MKKLIVALVLSSLLPQQAFAQTNKSNEIVPLFNRENNCQLRYYYYPNLEAFFDSQQMLYHYKIQTEWKTAEEIPNGYRGYSMFNKYNVTITDYDDDNICEQIAKYKKKYPYISNERTKKLTALTR